MSKKVLQTVVLLLLLVVFPILSWVFLRDGLQYRLDARARLIPKAYLPADNKICQQGKIQVFYQGNSQAWEGRLQSLAEHFSDRSEILLFAQMDTLSANSLNDSLQKAWSLSGLDGSFHDAVFLIDTTCAINRGYELYSDQDMAALAEDIVFLLPLEKEKDFLIRREREK
jgi:hypothetical protein